MVCFFLAAQFSSQRRSPAVVVVVVQRVIVVQRGRLKWCTTSDNKYREKKIAWEKFPSYEPVNLCVIRVGVYASVCAIVIVTKKWLMNLWMRSTKAVFCYNGKWIKAFIFICVNEKEELEQFICQWSLPSDRLIVSNTAEDAAMHEIDTEQQVIWPEWCYTGMWDENS